MKILGFFIIIIVLGIFSCDSVIYEFDINESDISDKTLITDSLVIRNLILKNDTISGFYKWSEHVKFKFSDKAFYSSIRNRFDTCFMNHFDSTFYLIDTIKINDNIGYLIMSSYKVFIGKGYDRTLYLSIFNKDKRSIRTYMVAKSVDKGDGLIGGGEHIKSSLTKNNILTTYYHYYGYLDIGPHSKEDSVITKYDLNVFSILSVDTVKHIDKIGY